MSKICSCRHPLHRSTGGVQQVPAVEAEVLVALLDGVQVVGGGRCPSAAGRHDVSDGRYGAQVGELHPELMLVVQPGVALVPIQVALVALGDGPDTNRHPGSLARFDVGHAGAGVTSGEYQIYLSCLWLDFR